MPPGEQQNVVILGSTGSVGRSALSVIEHDGGARLRAFGLGAHSQRRRCWSSRPLAFRPRFIALTDPAAAAEVDGQLRGIGRRGALRAATGSPGWSPTRRPTGS